MSEPTLASPHLLMAENRSLTTTSPLSVVMATYNRGPLVADAIRGVLAQHGAPRDFELIVVDNNSTDGTRDVVAEFARADSRVRCLFEPRQGVSYARNTGLEAARGELVAFTDDDVVADRTWLASIERAFREFPEAGVIGGRVLPLWPAPPPAWLTPDQWGPLALVDYGTSPFQVQAENPICLVTANVVFRRAVFNTVGTFATEFQRVKDKVGSLEDHELLLRVLRNGNSVIYDPRLVIHAPVSSERMERAYHRRWRRGHGHFHALLRTEAIEQSARGTVLGVPLHLYREAVSHAGGWLAAWLRADPAGAFRHEAHLQFLAGFFATRRREFVHTPRPERRRLWPRPRLAALVPRSGR